VRGGKGSEAKEEGPMDVHLIDDPASRLGLELGAPVASGGSGGVRVDATGGGDGGRVGPLRGAPVGGAVHGLRLWIDLLGDQGSPVALRQAAAAGGGGIEAGGGRRN